MQNFIACNPRNIEQYRSKSGMNLGGDKIGTYVGAMWVVYGHRPFSVESGAFFMKKHTFC